MILFTTVVLNTYIALLSFQINGIMSSDFIRIFMLLFMVAESAALILLQIKNYSRQKKSRIELPFVIVTAVIFIIYLICYLPAVDLSVSRFTEFVFFPFCLIVTYTNFIRIKEEKTFDQILDIQFYYLIVVAAAFIFAQVIHKGEYKTNINTVYYVVFSFPFILQHKNPVKKWLGLGIILLCLFLSAKRAPLVAIILALLFYSNAREPVLKMLLKIGCLIFGILVTDAIFAQHFDVHMIQRLIGLAEDGGSGRINLIKQTLVQLDKASLIEFLVGHSLAPTGSAFIAGAHNDFLEALYRLGFLGFIIVLGYFTGIVLEINHFNKTGDYQNSSFLKAVLAMFFVISLFSQLLFLPTYVGLVSLSISFALARNRYYCTHSTALTH